MQFSPATETGPGAHVLARARPWWVAGQQVATQARLLHLIPSSGPRGSRVLIDPVDAIAPLPTAAAPRAASRAGWMRGLKAALAATAPAREPVSPAGAAVALLPFQLEPLLALQRGLAARLLVADGVGLGKTIQAALVIRELMAREPSARVLVVVPAGLRGQWGQELTVRAGLDPVAIDAARLAALAHGLPPGASPWPLVPLAIVSLDLIKQPDVVHGLLGGAWDLCVIDEAHLLTPGTARAHAARVVAERSLRLLLLTATPHDGHEQHYQALCELGRLWEREPLALFARARGTGGTQPTASPRSLRLAVRPSRSERHLHDLLARYIARVWTAAPRDRAAARLAMTVLAKRAASGPWALARSLERRLQMLESGPAGRLSQGTLFDTQADADEEDAVPDGMLGVPGLPPAQERLWLRLLIDAARAAVPFDRKIAVLRRLLRRSREPAIVFTEYRDTLRHCAEALRPQRSLAVLHGGLPADLRHEAAAAFLDGSATLLLATDAASLGLNLHTRCRLVVHLELPWNPLRLEQRTGRVDRLGQTRRVHAIELVSRSTWEARIAARLDERRARIEASRLAGAVPTADADPAGLLAEALDLPVDGACRADPDSRILGNVVQPALGAEARALVARLALRRLWLASGTRPDDRPLVGRVHGRARRRLGFERGVLAIQMTRSADARGERDRRLFIASWHGEPPPLPIPHHRAAWRPLLDALRRHALESVPPAEAADLEADAIVARRARIIGRRRAASRRAEQLALFPDRVPAAARARPAAPFDASTRGNDPGTASLRSVELVLLLVLE